MARLPYSLKVLLENALRLEDGESVTAADVEAIASWDATATPSDEIPFQPARVLMQDFTGVPAIVDLAAMRDAIDALGSDPARINPLVPVDLVIDHSVQVDAFGTPRAFDINADRDYERNRERYAFLRWGQQAFDNFRVVPPATGICHQVNLEYLSQVVFSRAGEGGGPAQAYPDTLVGTDSHTTMVNGLGVLGWGVGGIEAEAAMLGQPISMLLPQVVGFRLEGRLPDGRDGDRPRAHGDRDAARARGRGQVRRVLRAGPRGARARRPGDDRQHVAGVRLDLRDLPGRRRDPALPRVHRPPDRGDRAGRRLRTRAGDVRGPRLRRPDLLRDARARPGERRALDRGAEAPPGSDRARRRQGRLPRVAGRVRPRRHRPGGQRLRRGGRGVVPGLRPSGGGSLRRRRQAAARDRCGRDRRAASLRGRRRARGRDRGRARPRPGGDRRDHELHEHLQPVGDGRGRPAGAKRGRARARA